jgi:hypothetical protein
MKNLISLLIILLPWTAKSQKSDMYKTPIQDYIQIQFTGLAQYSSMPILFVVKKNVDFETIENRLMELGAHSTPSLSKKDKELVWKGLFKTIITDERTFSDIAGFVDKNLSFFDSKKRSEFSIIVNGEGHSIILNSQKEFFNELVKYLIADGCDTVIVNQINSYNK